MFRIPACSRVAVAALLLWAGNAATASAAGSRWEVGLGLDAARGDYGNSEWTTFLAVPLHVGYAPSPRWLLTLELPWVYQSNSVTTFGSIRTSRTTSPTPAAAGRSTGGPGGSGQLDLDPQQSADGLGDLTLAAEYSLLEGKGSLPRIAGLLMLKVPLADADRGLGTGGFDGGGGLAVVKWLDAVRLFANGRYVFRESTAQYAAVDYCDYALGLGYRFTDALRGDLWLQGASEQLSGAPAPLETRLGMVAGISAKSRLEAYLGHGLSDASPQLAGGLLLIRTLD